MVLYTLHHALCSKQRKRVRAPLRPQYFANNIGTRAPSKAFVVYFSILGTTGIINNIFRAGVETVNATVEEQREQTSCYNRCVAIPCCHSLCCTIIQTAVVQRRALRGYRTQFLLPIKTKQIGL